MIGAGLKVNLADDATLGVSYAGQLGSEVKQHGAIANFTMRF